MNTFILKGFDINQNSSIRLWNIELESATKSDGVTAIRVCIFLYKPILGN